MRSLKNTLVGIVGVASATLAGLALAQAAKEWASYGGDSANTRYSTLTQVTTKNVSKLQFCGRFGTVKIQVIAPAISASMTNAATRRPYVATEAGPSWGRPSFWPGYVVVGMCTSVFGNA